ncbi:MAG: RHS repeat-associated core domain-containing protein [Bacteroidia bacterium]|nr:RHS repeat-associated core domain-containing protein [Bacteroidia bacterium]
MKNQTQILTIILLFGISLFFYGCPPVSGTYQIQQVQYVSGEANKLEVKIKQGNTPTNDLEWSLDGGPWTRLTEGELAKLVSSGSITLPLGAALEPGKSYVFNLRYQENGQQKSASYKMTIPKSNAGDNEDPGNDPIPPVEPKINLVVENGNYGLDLNWTKVEVPLEPFQNDAQMDAAIPQRKVNRNIKYFSGTGKLLQRSAIAASPSGKDIVIPTRYDESLAETRSYLPFVAAGSQGNYYPNAIDLQKQYYSYAHDGLPASNFPWSDNILESSPQKRLMETGSPGEDFQPGTGHTLRVAYRSNLQNEVWHWDFDAGMDIWRQSRAYPPGTLIVSEITDPNGNHKTVYKNQNNRKILEIENRDKSTQLKTWYLYDARGNLVLVIYPEGSYQVESSQYKELTRQLRDLYCATYTYDEKNRLVEVKSPGSEPQYSIFDGLDREIMVQDGLLRKGNTWKFTKYDRAGRKILEGLYIHPSSVNRVQMQALADAHRVSGKPQYHEDPSKSSSFEYYTNSAFPVLATWKLLEATWYDHYDVNQDGNPDFAFQSDPEFPGNEPDDLNTDRTTKTKVANVFSVGGLTPTFTINWFFYNKEGLIIQTKSIRNNWKDDLENQAYNFSGKPIRRKLIQISGGISLTLRDDFEYDAFGAQIRHYHQVNNQPKMLVSHNVLNELGNQTRVDLLEKSPGSGTFHQSITSEYNDRGLKTHEFAGPMPGSSAPALSLSYDYEKPNPLAGSGMPRFDGSISGQWWETAESPGKRGYSFSFDASGQLTQAKFVGLTQNSPFSGRYSVDGLQYDRNGNILRILRNGATNSETGTFGEIDNLSYVYQGNHLIGVSDAASNHDPENQDFIDRATGVALAGNPTTHEYLYDDAGNLIEDKNKGMTIFYNEMGMPQNIRFSPTTYLEYVYDARGIKQAKTVRENNQVTRSVQYKGSVVYEDGKAKYVIIPEGRVLINTPQPVYECHFRDHLNNVRMAFSLENGQLKISQEKHFYPFGMKQAGDGTASLSDNPYLYNGKEAETDLGLNWYDYGARFYDPQLGRWHANDPAGEFESPYVYTGNNPVNFYDPDGQEIRVHENGRDFNFDTRFFLLVRTIGSFTKLGTLTNLAYKGMSTGELTAVDITGAAFSLAGGKLAGNITKSAQAQGLLSRGFAQDHMLGWLASSITDAPMAVLALQESTLLEIDEISLDYGRELHILMTVNYGGEFLAIQGYRTVLPLSYSRNKFFSIQKAFTRAALQTCGELYDYQVDRVKLGLQRLFDDHWTEYLDYNFPDDLIYEYTDKALLGDFDPK